MSDTVLLAIVGVVLALVNGGVAIAVGAWANSKRERTAASVATEATTQAARVRAAVAEQEELSKVRGEYKDRVAVLETRLNEKDGEIRALWKELSDARSVISGQAAQIRALEADIAEMHREREKKT